MIVAIVLVHVAAATAAVAAIRGGVQLTGGHAVDGRNAIGRRAVAAVHAIVVTETVNGIINIRYMLVLQAICDAT